MIDESNMMTFWIVAWCMMGLAFSTAVIAILVGAIGLDREKKDG